MTLIAHLSDLHLLEPEHHIRTGLAKSRLWYFNLGAVSSEYDYRYERVAAALEFARKMNASHYVITGDLTEDGVLGQFETFSQILSNSQIPPELISLVPGNHDAYGGTGVFNQVLEAGCLSQYQSTSLEGTRVILPGAVILPIHTMIDDQLFFVSSGRITERAIKLIEDTLLEFPTEAIIVAMHHPPRKNQRTFFSAYDQLVGFEGIQSLVENNERLFVLHGHVHRNTTKTIKDRWYPQIFSTASVRDHGDGLAVRFYEVLEGRIRSVVI